jgi:hypothetical protein
MRFFPCPGSRAQFCKDNFEDLAEGETLVAGDDFGRWLGLHLVILRLERRDRARMGSCDEYTLDGRKLWMWD